MGRVLLTRTLQWRARQDVGVVDALLRRSRVFWLGGPKPQITCYDVIRNFKKGIFWGGKISKNGRSETVAWCWHVTRNSLKGEGLNLKLKCENIKIGRRGAPSRRRLGGLWAKPPAAMRFFVIFWKKSYFNTSGSCFARIQSHLKANWKN